MKSTVLRVEDLVVTSFATVPSRLNEAAAAGPITQPVSCGCGTYNGWCTSPGFPC